MDAVISSATQTHLQQFRACLGICRSCLETAKPSAAHRAGLTDLVLALEIAVAMIEINYQHAVDQLRYCGEVFSAVSGLWFEGGSVRCRACVRICGEILREWGGYRG
jgi:hypothetical protein